MTKDIYKTEYFGDIPNIPKELIQSSKKTSGNRSLSFEVQDTRNAFQQCYRAILNFFTS